MPIIFMLIQGSNWYCQWTTATNQDLKFPFNIGNIVNNKEVLKFTSPIAHKLYQGKANILRAVATTDKKRAIKYTHAKQKIMWWNYDKKNSMQ